MPNPAEVVRFVLRNSRRIAVSIVGFLLVALGLAMLVLPGPGILLLVVGFAVLGTEYTWACTALERTKGTAEQAGRVARQGAARAAGGARGAARSARSRIDRRPPAG